MVSIMTKHQASSWPFYEHSELGFSLDIRGMLVSDEQRQVHRPLLASASMAMRDLEAGAIANPSEGRRVGHYWLRTPEIAPETEITQAIQAAAQGVQEVTRRLEGFEHVLHLGIGGSALGPQLLVDALSEGTNRSRLRFLDNIDPIGVSDALEGLDLAQTACVVVSKSGGTAETMGCLDIVEKALAAQGLSLAERAVAVTGEGSRLFERAAREAWLATLPMWDWVGGRTSVTSAVGLLPAALSQVDAQGLCDGARVMDEWTRSERLEDNPAMAMALAWWLASEGRAKRANVVLPYADRLRLLAPYLQQLVMESLGKSHDRSGRIVHQGLTVYGNKGATDQHAYVQQLREGPDDHFLTFVEVLSGRAGQAGDTLSALMAGTRSALSEAGRRVMTLSLHRLDATSLGALIALFERAVGLYATFADINAYDQPGVEAGKRCAADILALQARLVAALDAGQEGDASTLASALEAREQDVFHVLRHLAANGRARSEGQGLSRRFSAPD